VSAVVPYEVSGAQQTVVEYQYNSVMSNSVTLAVAPSAPAIFTQNASGTGPGSIRNSDYSLNTAANPAAGGDYVIVFATGGGTLVGGATDGALAPATALQTLPVTATIGGMTATVLYAGAAPGEVNGVMQVNLTVPTGLTGVQPLMITVNSVASQNGVTVAVK
jgi:uncharacterized protein (TIGR03437 family)